MSYDINFWKQKRSLTLSAQEIYERLCQKEPVEGLATLPVHEILSQLRAAFPDFNPDEPFPDVRTSDGSIEISWSDQHFRFDIRGNLCADCQKVVDIMADFDCPMFDPQDGKRHDAKQGTALGERPIFRDMLPEQKEAINRAIQDMLAKIDAPPSKRGCTNQAARVLLGLLVILGMVQLFR